VWDFSLDNTDIFFYFQKTLHARTVLPSFSNLNSFRDSASVRNRFLCMSSTVPLRLEQVPTTNGVILRAVSTYSIPRLAEYKKAKGVLGRSQTSCTHHVDFQHSAH
jgi:hypothetical protein